MANLFKVTKTKILNKIDITKMKAQKHAPELLIGAGIVLTTGAVIFACKKTMKLQGIIDDHKQGMADINAAVEAGDKEYKDEDGTVKTYTAEDGKQDKVILTKETVFKVAGNYLLPFLMFGSGIALIIGGAVKGNNMRNDLSEKLGASMAAMAALRERMRDRLGDEMADDIYYGRNNFEYTEMHEDGTNETKNVKTAPRKTGTPTEFFFNSQTSSKFENGPLGTQYNMSLIKSILAQLEDERTAPWGGRIIRLNRVLSMLGMKEEGRWDGWGWLPNDIDELAEAISFGLEKYSDGVNGIDIPEDGEIILEFNCQYIADKY